MTMNDLKMLAAAVMMIAWTAPSKAQTIDWGNDPVGQVSAQLKPVVSIASAQTASAPTSPAETRIHVEFRCTPDGNKPTDEIGSIQIGHDSYRQYDGGYVPLSPVHAQGYEFFIVGNTLSIRLLDRSEASIVIGYVGTKKACTWEEIAESPVIEASLLELTKEIGPVTACGSQIIDSRPVYSKSAELTLTLMDVEFGRKAVLKSKIGTVGASTKEECERAVLKD
jgi:hypothetical protein